jgi:4-amino-4-deoxy-L-arabinose transferase-like glycosyltransferase
MGAAASTPAGGGHDAYTTILWDALLSRESQKFAREPESDFARTAKIDSKFIRPLALVFVLLLAATVRFQAISSSLPYYGYVDEGHLLRPTISLVKSGGWDPAIDYPDPGYSYPSLTFYLIAGAIHIARPVYRMVRGHSILLDLHVDDTYYDLVSPPQVIVLGRMLIATMSVATVFVVFLLAQLLAGQWAGLLAALIAALCPALVTRGSIVIVDTVSAFFAVSALFFARRLEDATSEAPVGASGTIEFWSLGDAVLAGACAGLAATAKYPAGAVFFAVAFVILSRRHHLRQKVQLLFAATAAMACAVAISMPAIVLKTHLVVSDLIELSRVYADPAAFPTLRRFPSYFETAVRSRELGIPLAAAAIFGMGWMLVKPPMRTTGSSWWLFGSILLAPLIAHRFQPFRNVLPLVPALCIAAALPLTSPCRTAWQRWTKTISGAVVVASLATATFHLMNLRTGLVDSRVALVNWLSAHVGQQDRILAISELTLHPSELRRIPASVTDVPWLNAVEVLESGQFDYFVVGELDLVEVDRPDWPAYLERFRKVSSRYNRETSFGGTPTPAGPLLWRGNNELLIVLRPRVGEPAKPH